MLIKSATNITAIELLQYPLAMPVFRSPFRWTTNDLGEELWTEWTNRIRTPSQTRNHTFGVIVLQRQKAHGFGTGVFHIVDGGRRVVTVAMTLAAIRDRAADIAPNHPVAASINAVLSPHAPKIEFWGEEQNVYKRILRRQAVENTSALKRAYDFFYAHAKNIEEEMLLASLLETVAQKTTFVVLHLDEKEQAHSVYERLNRPASGITMLDRLRIRWLASPITTTHGGDYFVELTDKLQRSVENLAYHLERDENTAFTGFMTDYCLVKDGIVVEESDVFQKCLDAVASPKDVESKISVIDDWLKYLSVYVPMVSAQCYTEFPKKIARALKVFSIFNDKYYRAALLALGLHYLRGLTETEKFLRALQHLENFLMRRKLAGFGEEGLSAAMPKIVMDLRTGRYDETRFVHALLSAGYPSNEEVLSGTRKNFYGSGFKALTRHLLIRINAAVTRFGSYEANDYIEFDKVEIEHILPQSYHSWKNDLESVGQWSALQSNPSVIHSLGNLTLIFKGDLIGNGHFEVKKQMYEKIPIKITQDLCKLARFGPAEIAMRERELLQLTVDEVYPDLKAVFGYKTNTLAAGPTASGPKSSAGPTALSNPSTSDLKKLMTLYKEFVSKNSPCAEADGYSIAQFDTFIKDKGYKYPGELSRYLAETQCFDVANDKFKLSGTDPLKQEIVIHFENFTKLKSTKSPGGWYLISAFGNYLKSLNYPYNGKLTAFLKNCGRFEFHADEKSAEYFRLKSNPPAPKSSSPVSSSASPVPTSGSNDISTPKLLLHLFIEYKSKISPENNVWFLVSAFGAYIKNQNYSYNGKLTTLLQNCGLFEFHTDEKSAEYFRLKSNPPAPKSSSPVNPTSPAPLSAPPVNPALPLNHTITSIGDIPIEKLQQLARLFDEYSVSFIPSSKNGFYKSSDFEDYLKSLGYDFGDDFLQFILKTHMFVTIKSEDITWIRIIPTPSPPGLFMSMFYKFQKTVQRPSKIYTLSEFESFLQQENVVYPESLKQIICQTGVFDHYTNPNNVTYFSFKTILSLLETQIKT